MFVDWFFQIKCNFIYNESPITIFYFTKKKKKWTICKIISSKLFVYILPFYRLYGKLCYPNAQQLLQNCIICHLQT